MKIDITFGAIVGLRLDGHPVADATPPNALGAVVGPARPEAVLGGAGEVDLLAAPDGLVALEGGRWWMCGEISNHQKVRQEIKKHH